MVLVIERGGGWMDEIPERVSRVRQEIGKREGAGAGAGAGENKDFPRDTTRVQRNGCVCIPFRREHHSFSCAHRHTLELFSKLDCRIYPLCTPGKVPSPASKKSERARGLVNKHPESHRCVSEGGRISVMSCQ